MKSNKTIDYYNKNAGMFYTNTAELDLSPIYKIFLKYIKKKGSLLDLGCGSGRDSLYFLNNEYDVTSMDASSEMVKLSSKLTERQTINKKIEDIDFKNKFDGIWACASLLHINRRITIDVFNKLRNSLKTNGVLFASYKYGIDEIVEEGRYFNNYDENTFRDMIKNIEGLNIVKVWITEDLRKDRNNEKWLNILLIKSNDI